MESTRQKKVSRLIQKELADIFLKRGKRICTWKAGFNNQGQGKPRPVICKSLYKYIPG